MKIRISIIVPTKNRSNSVIGLLNSVIRQKIPPSAYEILIIDNASTDGTAEQIKLFILQNQGFRIRYIYEEIPGLLSGRHRGFREAHADILTFLDDDVLLGPEYTLHILHAFADERVGIVGGPSVPRFEKEPPAWLEHYFHKKKGIIECGPLSLLDFGSREKDIAPEYVWGLNFSIRKQILYDLGGFHPDGYPQELLFLRGDGETGLALKAKEQRVIARYVPGVRVEHIIPASRLTVQYFKLRFFAQGISDSYTLIRRMNGISDTILPPQETYNMLNPADIYSDVYRSYIDGFLYHQDAVKQSPELLSWVLRKTYFDYVYPDIFNMWKPETSKQTPPNIDANDTSNIYNSEFYKEQSEGSALSASIVVPIIQNIFSARSVSDFGCGIGTWLKYFLLNGVQIVQGYDINLVEHNILHIPSTNIIQGCDFTINEFPIAIKTDLAISLEVAEHLPEDSAKNFIKTLTAASQCIVFSAALPSQTGINHLNEQPFIYWQKLFLEKDYLCFDPIRPLIFANNNIQWWYRQNIFVFVERKFLHSNRKLFKRLVPYIVNGNKMNYISNFVLNRLCNEHFLLTDIVMRLKNIKISSDIDNLINIADEYVKKQIKS